MELGREGPEEVRWNKSSRASQECLICCLVKCPQTLFHRETCWGVEKGAFRFNWETEVRSVDWGSSISEFAWKTMERSRRRREVDGL